MRQQLAGMSWDVCPPTHGVPSRPTVTVNIKAGRLNITQAAYEAAGRPAAIILLYSAEHKSIGLRPADPRDGGTLMVSGSTRAGKQVAAGMLSRRLAADGYGGILVLPVQWHPDGLLWGDLTQATRSSGRKGKAKGGAE